jgi:hypothetical protein
MNIVRSKLRRRISLRFTWLLLDKSSLATGSLLPEPLEHKITIVGCRGADFSKFQVVFRFALQIFPAGNLKELKTQLTTE